MKIGDKVVIKSYRGAYGSKVSGPFEITGETKTLWKVNGRSFLKSHHQEYGGGGSYSIPAAIYKYDPVVHNKLMKDNKLHDKKMQTLSKLRTLRLTDLTDEVMTHAEALLNEVSK